jgi:hypothetical protein
MEAGSLIVALLRAKGLADPYPLVAPQDTPRPYLCYQLISQVPEAGASASCPLGETARVQLSLFADDYATLARLTASVRAALDYQQPAPGVLLEFNDAHDHQDPLALCLFRSLDYLVELP